MAPDNNDSNEQIEDILAELWQKHLPTLHERLDLLDRAAAEASAGTLPEDSRLEAYNVAHKLAGNLGMFGHPHSSEIASEIEHLLKSPTPEALTQLAPLAASLRASLADVL